MSKRRSAGSELLKKSRNLNLLAENIKKNFVKRPTRLVNLSSSINTSQSDVSFVVPDKSPSGRKPALKTAASSVRTPIRPKAPPAQAKPKYELTPASSSLVQVAKHRNHMSPVVVLNGIPDKSHFKKPDKPRNDRLASSVKSSDEPHLSNHQNSSVKKIFPENECDKPWSDFKKPAPPSVAKSRYDNPVSSSSKSAVSSSSDKGYSSDARSNSGRTDRKRKEEEVPVIKENILSSPESFSSCSPTKINKFDDDTSMEMTANSFTSGLSDSVSYCLTRRKNQLNMSLHQSFLSLGTLSFDTSFATLPEVNPSFICL